MPISYPDVELPTDFDSGAITVLIPTRNRPKLLQKAVESCFNLASDPQSIQVGVNIEPDDTESYQALCELKQAGDPKYLFVRFAPERIGWHGIHIYNAAMFPQSRGEWFFFFTDDTFLLTQGWDDVVRQSLKGVLAGDAKTLGINICPFIHRDVFLAIGMSPTPHYDIWFEGIAKGAGCHFNIPVDIFHDRYDLTGNNNDQTFRDAQASRRLEEFYGQEVQAAMQEKTELLRATIENRKGAL